MKLKRPTKLSLAHTPTPLKFLPRVSAKYGKRIWMKSDDLTGCLISGNKVRKLEYLLKDALDRGADTVITCGGLQSNHCRATAGLCAQLGLNCHLILRADDDFSEVDKEHGLESFSEITGNLLLSQLCGAKISIYSRSHYVRHLSQIVEQTEVTYTQQKKLAYFIPTGGSSALGLWGYIDAYNEMQQQCHEQGLEMDRIVCASGSGGTQGGLTLGAALAKHDVRVTGFAVCDSEKYFREKILQDVTQWQNVFCAHENLAKSLNIHTVDTYIGPGYGKAYDALIETIQLMAQIEGVVLDPVYTGKAFHGMLKELECGRLSGNDIVFLHSGGIFGVFPFAEPLAHRYS